jgi:succinate-semialdehyde dehydrogenase/glutarate-semialdehyde dehydrogenase/succinyl-CoA reductase
MKAARIVKLNEHLQVQEPQTPQTKDTQILTKIQEARSEVEKCVCVMDYFADNGKVFTTDELVNTDARKTIVTFESLGVIGSIMPRNFPYWQTLRFAAPPLMVGNRVPFGGVG